MHRVALDEAPQAHDRVVVARLREAQDSERQFECSRYPDDRVGGSRHAALCQGGTRAREKALCDFGVEPRHDDCEAVVARALLSLQFHAVPPYRGVSNIRAGTNYTPRPAPGRAHHCAHCVATRREGPRSGQARTTGATRRCSVRRGDGHGADGAPPRHARAQSTCQRPRDKQAQPGVAGCVRLLVRHASGDGVRLRRREEDRRHGHQHRSPQPGAARPAHSGSGYSSQPRT